MAARNFRIEMQLIWKRCQLENCESFENRYGIEANRVPSLRSGLRDK
jgi:hypothetical protein